MSQMSKKLENMLFEKLNHSCTVKYEGKRKGWIFSSPELHPQRLGFNYIQAIKFIQTYDWSWIKNYLEENK